MRQQYKLHSLGINI